MSSTTTTNIDYINTNFAYPTITKITGIPTYAQLKTIKDELETNAGTIQCDLGGRQNGHLDLLLTNNECVTISATPYICLIHPGPVIPVGTTNYGSQVLHDNHHKQIHLFQEANGVKEALLKQLHQALPELYLHPYCNTNLNQITTPICTILQELLTTYGGISDEELEEKGTALKTQIFDITQPMVHLYQAVDDLKDLAIASNSPYLERQLIALSLCLVKNMNELEKARERWMEKLDHAKLGPTSNFISLTNGINCVVYTAPPYATQYIRNKPTFFDKKFSLLSNKNVLPWYKK